MSGIGGGYLTKNKWIHDLQEVARLMDADELAMDVYALVQLEERSVNDVATALHCDEAQVREYVKKGNVLFNKRRLPAIIREIRVQDGSPFDYIADVYGVSEVIARQLAEEEEEEKQRVTRAMDEEETVTRRSDAYPYQTDSSCESLQLNDDDKRIIMSAWKQCQRSELFLFFRHVPKKMIEDLVIQELEMRLHKPVVYINQFLSSMFTN